MTGEAQMTDDEAELDVLEKMIDGFNGHDLDAIMDPRGGRYAHHRLDRRAKSTTCGTSS